MRTALLHARRIKRNSVKFAQATTGMHDKSIADLTDMINCMTEVPWFVSESSGESMSELPEPEITAIKPGPVLDALALPPPPPLPPDISAFAAQISS